MSAAHILKDRDLKRALNHCQTRRHTQRDQTIIQVSVLAGLRVCEIAALRVGDVFEANGAVRHCVTLQSNQTKGQRARVFYVNQKLARVLRDYWRLVADQPAEAALFQTQRGGEFSANTLCQLFLDIYYGCGLQGVSSHSGRRTFITRLADQGVAVHVLAALAGHKHIGTTQRYISVNDAMLARAAELA